MSASTTSTTEKHFEVPPGYCQCGCGQRTRRRADGTYARFVRNHHMRGPRNNNYNMGLSFHKGLKRWRICCRDGTTVLYSRAVMEAHLGRKLEPHEIVHHINGDTTDDRIENLALFSSPAKHLKEAHPRRAGRKPSFRYTREALLSALKDLAQRVGRTPTYGDIKRDPRMPSWATYRRWFGRLQNALREAGLVEH